MSSVTKIVLTGAPCSGKTTALKRIKSYFGARGRDVIICPEAATIAIQNGVKRDDMYAFEAEVARLQLELEDECVKKAKDGSVIILDRGLTDCFSYVDDAKRFSSEYVHQDYAQTWNRYDAVIMLESVGETDYHTSDVRIEDYSYIKEAQERLLNVYVGHPHFRFVKSQNDFEKKLTRTIAEIDAIIGSVETEVKYLIEFPDIPKVMELPCKKTNISQTYLLSQIGTHRIRERVVDGYATYFETLKLRLSGMSAQEHESIISKEEYDELMQSADPNKSTIVKDRYCFLYDGQYFELDVYPFWSDKAIIELELTDENQQVILPSFIKLIEDVSNKKEYKNNYLASLKL